MISSADEATGTVVGAVTGKLPTTGEGTSRVFVGKVQDTNTPNNTVYLRKTDNSDTPNPLTGAEFRLSYLSSPGAFTVVKADLKPVIAADNAEAKVEIGPLTYDTIYKLEETKAPDGYIITENGFLFRLGTDGKIQLFAIMSMQFILGPPSIFCHGAYYHANLADGCLRGIKCHAPPGTAHPKYP